MQGISGVGVFQKGFFVLDSLLLLTLVDVEDKGHAD